MAQAPEHAARAAAEQVYSEVLAMLTDGDTGEVAVIVDYHRLEVQARPVFKRKTVKVARGQMTPVERVG